MECTNIHFSVQKLNEKAGLLYKMNIFLGENERSYNKSDFNCVGDCFQPK